MKRTTKGLHTRPRGSALLALLLVPVLLPAQVPVDIADRIRANQNGLVQYAWTMRVQIERAGESLGTTAELLRFNDQGYVDRTLVHDDRTKAARKKNVQALVERLVATIIPYVAPNPDAAGKFLADAVVELKNGRLRIRGQGFVDPEDTVDLIVDAEAMRAVSMAVVTSFEEALLKIRAEYEPLPGGPNHVARITVDYAPDDLRLTIENSDYEKVR